MTTAFLILLAALAVVLLVSGIAKIRSTDTQEELAALGVPAALRHPVFLRLHPWAEIALGLGLLVTSGWLLALVAAGATALMGLYAVLITRAVRTGSAERCNCFGELFDARLTWRSVARNLTLVGISLVVLAGALAGWSAPGIVGETPGAVLAVLAAAVVGGLTWTIVTTPSPTPETSPAPAAEDEEELDYVRYPIPFAWVESADGARSTVRELAQQKARLLVFLSTGCGACVPVAKDLPGWVEEFGMLGVHPVFFSTREQAREVFPELEPFALYEKELEASRAFGVKGYPTAVALGMDGLLAGGPVVGYGAIATMVEEMRAELGVAAEAEAAAELGVGAE